MKRNQFKRANLPIFKHEVYFYSLQLDVLRVCGSNQETRSAREREKLCSRIEMSLSLEDKVQKCIKTPLNTSSDQTAWAIASKWMSHFVFIC